MSFSLRIAVRAVLMLLAYGPLLSFATGMRDRPFYQASRALMMGDAYTAYGSGYEAVYYNPAGIAKPNKLSVKVMDLELHGSSNVLPLIADNYTLLVSPTALIKEAVKEKNKPMSAAMSLTPQMLTKNFSIGFLMKTYTEATLDGSSDLLDCYSYTDAAVYMHTGVAFGGGILKLGVGMKALDRAEIFRQYDPDVYTAGMSVGGQWKEGIGYGLDAGMLLTYPGGALPTLGIAVQDLGLTKLTEKHLIWSGSLADTGAPRSLQQRVNVGVSINPKHGRGVKSVLALEVKDVLRMTNILDNFHAGWELDVIKVVVLRAGLNQGRYWTAGFGVTIASSTFEIGSYAENSAFDHTGRRSDRKYVARYMVAF